MAPTERPKLRRLLWLLALWLVMATGNASCTCCPPEKPACTAKGASCFESDECCTGFCSRDKCLCMPDKGGCTQDDQCCSGTCEGNKCKPTT